MTAQPPAAARRAILGVGAVLLSDEGVGVHAVRLLEEMEVPEGVVVFDGGTEGLGLMDFITSVDRLVIIDCVRGGQEPGTVYMFEPGDLGSAPDIYQTSIHQVGILEVLHMADLVGSRPWTTVIGVEPASLEIGEALSPVVLEKLQLVAGLALEEIGKARKNLPRG